MLDLSALMEKMGEIIFYIVLGFAGYKWKVFNTESNRVFSALIVNIGLPCLMFSSMVNSGTGKGPMVLLSYLGLGLLWQGIHIVMAFLIARPLKREKSEYRNFVFMLSFGNIGIFGLPVIQQLFGSEGVVIASLFSVIFNLFAYTFGRLLIQKNRPQRREMLGTLLSPCVLVGIFSFIAAAFEVPIPGPILNAAAAIGSATLPLLMFTVGSLLAASSVCELRSMPRALCCIPLKLLLVPALLWFSFRFFVKDPVALGVVTVLGSMPVAGIATAMNVLYGNHEKEASTVVLFSTLLSLLTIPLVCTLLLT